mmetsp:Transcript_82049/g.211435  ORF Transcript_82049/g.211435 Transcript_82049/m.211435 type:complete len:228 (+) Transcript_82049:360-1043(+)
MFDQARGELPRRAPGPQRCPCHVTRPSARGEVREQPRSLHLVVPEALALATLDEVAELIPAPAARDVALGEHNHRRQRRAGALLVLVPLHFAQRGHIAILRGHLGGRVHHALRVHQLAPPRPHRVVRKMFAVAHPVLMPDADAQRALLPLLCGRRGNLPAGSRGPHSRGRRSRGPHSRWRRSRDLSCRLRRRRRGVQGRGRRRRGRARLRAVVVVEVVQVCLEVLEA